MTALKRPVSKIPMQLLFALGAAMPSWSHADKRRFVNHHLGSEQHKDSPPCPRCKTRRTWQPPQMIEAGDERFRCRDCGTRFVPVPPAPPEPPQPPEPLEPVTLHTPLEAIAPPTEENMMRIEEK